ncbi:hypothetical protein YC2023_112825 [Brassica napus]
MVKNGSSNALLSSTSWFCYKIPTSEKMTLWTTDTMNPVVIGSQAVVVMIGDERNVLSNILPLEDSRYACSKPVGLVNCLPEDLLLSSASLVTTPPKSQGRSCEEVCVVEARLENIKKRLE